MKKILLFVLIAVLAISAAVGIAFGVKEIKKDKDGNGHNIECELNLIEEKYNKGDLVLFQYVVTADVELVSLTYKINNGDEVSMTVKTGATEELEEKVGSGEFFIDSGVEIIDTAEMATGHYVIVAYARDAEGTIYNISDPFMFEIVTAG